MVGLSCNASWHSVVLHVRVLESEHCMGSKRDTKLASGMPLRSWIVTIGVGAQETASTCRMHQGWIT